MVRTWVLSSAEREIERLPDASELWAMLAELAASGQVPPGWHRPETGGFDALGRPGTTSRVYYARHAGQYVVLLAAKGKRGRGKLEPQRRRTIETRLRGWKDAYPEGKDE